MRFLDFFSGIGGFRLGMEMAGHTCVGHCEVDKFADRSYRAMHNVKESEWYANDITRVEPEELPEADCYCFGFPCQAFSIAGKRRGFEDTRGTLFFEVMRLARERKPRLLFAENVRGLLNHEGGQTFGVIVSTMDELGYDVEWQVLNSKHFGVPQNRERVFIVGHLRETGGRKVFPVRRDDGVPDPKRLETEPGVPALTATSYKGVSKRRGGLAIPVMTPDRPNKRQNGRRFKENGDEMFTLTAQDRQGVMVREATCKQVIGGSQGNRVYDPSGISVTLSSQGGGRGAKTGLHAVIQRPRGYNKGGVHNEAPTLTGNSWQQNNFATDGMRIRRLTPRECFRLQGFPDEYFDRAAAVNSDSQLYKQAGNSVTVNVIYEIAKRLEV